MANTIIFVILLNLGVKSDCVYVPLYKVMAQELAWQVQILGPASAGFFLHEPSASKIHIMIYTYTSFGSTQKWAKGAELPVALWYQTAPRRCKQHQPLLPGPPCWPGSRSSRPWSRWWTRGAWCRWPTAWCGHTSAQRHHSLSMH